MNNPHDQLLQRAWQNCRDGMKLCERDEHARQKALTFSQHALAVAPSHMQRWIELLEGEHAKHLQQLFTAESFFDLSREEQAWWDQLVQSHPFAPLAKTKEGKRTLG